MKTHRLMLFRTCFKEQVNGYLLCHVMSKDQTIGVHTVLDLYVSVSLFVSMSIGKP